MFQNKLLRVSLDLAILISIFFLPFWVTLILGTLGIFFFSWFWEALVMAIIIDGAYGSPVTLNGSKLFFVVLIMLLVVQIIFKRFTRFYEHS